MGVLQRKMNLFSQIPQCNRREQHSTTGGFLEVRLEIVLLFGEHGDDPHGSLFRSGRRHRKRIDNLIFNSLSEEDDTIGNVVGLNPIQSTLGISDKHRAESTFCQIFAQHILLFHAMFHTQHAR